tara:strand:+ start:546 stop:818 length:273 start_codon:yes stop_codon:yes gene_type:complete
MSISAKIFLPAVGNGINLETYLLESIVNDGNTTTIITRYYDKITGLSVMSEIQTGLGSGTLMIEDTLKDSNNDGTTDLQHLLEFRTNPLE